MAHVSPVLHYVFRSCTVSHHTVVVYLSYRQASACHGCGDTTVHQSDATANHAGKECACARDIPKQRYPVEMAGNSCIPSFAATRREATFSGSICAMTWVTVVRANVQDIKAAVASVV